LNFSHGTHDEHADMVRIARKAARQARREIALMGDLPGPKLRVGDIPGGVVELREGDTVTLTLGEPGHDASRIPVSWSGLPGAVQEGDAIYLADGRIRLRARTPAEDAVETVCEIGGPLASHQGLNLPGADDLLPTASALDLAWVDFALEQGIDLLAVSFVRGINDLAAVESHLRERGADIPLIAKIEKRRAAEHAEEIVEAATGGIMVARGDLGIEVDLERVPLIQKRLLALAGKYSKPSITATQMLASMVHSPRPTRAEAADVANAIYDGTDAVMLSEETAVGDYPVGAVQTMVRIAAETERDLPYAHWLLHRTQRGDRDVADTVASGAVAAVYQLGLAALVVPTQSGRTARLVSAHRPKVSVLALSPRLETVRRLNLLFGVTCELHEPSERLNELLDSCAQRARETGVARSGDLIGITAGLPGHGLGTNLFEVQRVP
jgi:pyruvate kinase